MHGSWAGSAGLMPKRELKFALCVVPVRADGRNDGVFKMKFQRAKTVTFGGILLCVTATTSAWAADLGPYRPYTPPPPAPIQSYAEPPIWEGAYIGLNGGYGWSSSNFAEPDGAFGGGQIGYNWQRDRFVFGVEGDIQASDINASKDVAASAMPRLTSIGFLRFADASVSRPDRGCSMARAALRLLTLQIV